VVKEDGAFTVELLADRPHLVEAVGLMRWQEWGHEPEPESVAWWVGTTTQEAGRDELPITLVAIDQTGVAIGAVGLSEFDIQERRDRSPWIVGMIVRADRRRRGVGRTLLARLEAFADSHHHHRLWVATETAAPFYEECGYRPAQVVARLDRPPIDVLTKSFTDGSDGPMAR
jgi:predicted N-acetyltransferase YhbS